MEKYYFILRLSSLQQFLHFTNQTVTYLQSELCCVNSRNSSLGQLVLTARRYNQTSGFQVFIDYFCLLSDQAAALQSHLIQILNVFDFYDLGWDCRQHA